MVAKMLYVADSDSSKANDLNGRSWNRTVDHMASQTTGLRQPWIEKNNNKRHMCLRKSAACEFVDKFTFFKMIDGFKNFS